MKVNLIGLPQSHSINSHLVPLFWRQNIEAYVNGWPPSAFDITIFCGLWYLDKRYLEGPTIMLAVGSDVYRDMPNQLPELKNKYPLLRQIDLTLMANDAMLPYLTPYTDNLCMWHVPIDTQLFKKSMNRARIQRDTLLYCGAPDHQHLNRIVKYVRDHPYKECTLLGQGYQNFLMETIPNLITVRWIPYEIMPHIFNRHKEYRLYLKRNVDLISKMTCEALTMGCKAFSNDIQITDIPEHMLDTVAMPKLLEYMEELI